MPLISPSTVQAPRSRPTSIHSDRSGLHRAHIGEIERGDTNVTLLTLKTLADALSVRITDLLRGL